MYISQSGAIWTWAGGSGGSGGGAGGAGGIAGGGEITVGIGSVDIVGNEVTGGGGGFTFASVAKAPTALQSLSVSLFTALTFQ